MAKKTFCKTFFKTCVFLFGSAFLLAGCNNFLKGADTAEKLRAAVNYANAKQYLIKVQPEKGTGSVVKPASGEALKKITDVFEIKFEPSQEYEFVTWKVSSKKLTTGQNINDYITIEDPSKPETTVTFKKELEDIVITPVVARRPKLLSKSPEKSGGLALKDTKIQVIFDRKMDRSSIYYSVDEIKELKTELDLQDQDFLPENAVIGTTNIYGYKKTNSKGEVEYFYKNILIKNNDTQENITDRFEAPYFETPTTLVIPPNKNNYPDGYTYISVSLDKNFCYNFEYEKNSKKIGLLESADWVYQVNNSTDNVPPRMTKSSIKYNDKTLDTFDSSDATNYEYSNWCSNATLLSKDNKNLDINLEAGDEGSGLTSYFDVELCRVVDGRYLPCSETKTTIKTDFSLMGASVSSFDGNLDLKDFPDGIYSISFVLHDNNGIESYWPKKDDKNACSYVIIDDGVNMDWDTDFDPTNNDKRLIMNWGNPAKDLTEIKFEYYYSNKWQEMGDPLSISDIFPSSGEPLKSQKIRGLDYAEKINLRITFTDNKGHSSTITKNNCYTRPAPATWEPITPTYGTWEILVNLPETFDSAELIVSKSQQFTETTSYQIQDKNESNVYFISLNPQVAFLNASYQNPYYLKIRVFYKGKYTDSQKGKKINDSSITSIVTFDVYTAVNY
ncbi:MAG: hypothetical protein IK102_02720 [Treponema sp.]|nr:hypothetical protein [Treponema sp.]